jgi:NTE family protein
VGSTVETAPPSLQSAVVAHFGVPPGDAAAVLAEFSAVVCRGGEWLFHQGDPGDSLYLLVRGRLQVRLETPGGASRRVADVEPGEMVGEIGLLAGGTRSAGLRAVRDSLLLRLDAAGFDRLARAHPAWVRQLAGRIAVRLRDRTAGGADGPRHPRTVALVPLDAGPAALDLARALAAQVGGAVTVLHPTTLDSLGAPATGADPAALATPSMVEWLASVEDRSRLVCYVATPDDGAWSRLAVRHADLVLFVADATASPTPRGWERGLVPADGDGDGGSRCALVLRHAGRPATLAGTAAWLAPRALDFHVHLRTDEPGDLARLARMLAGDATGLVLGGGAARGFAHLGVYRAMSEAKVPIDWVGGASIGAVMGAGIAMMLPPDEAIRLAREAFVGGKPFGDVTIPVLSLLRGRRMERLIDALLPGEIEDLPVPYYCVSSNLGTGTLQIHERGALARAVRASVSLPGVFPPAVVNGQLTIDGGILDNLPVDRMRTRPIGRVIAVDLTSRQTYDVEYDAVPSPWRVLAGRFLPFVSRRRVPSFLATLLKATEIGTMAEVRAAAARADLLIRPPVARFGLTDVRSFDRIVQAGYDEARTALGG